MKLTASELTPGDRLDFGQFQSVQVVKSVAPFNHFNEQHYKVTMESGQAYEVSAGYKFSIAEPEPRVTLSDKVEVNQPLRPYRSALGGVSGRVDRQ